MAKPAARIAVIQLGFALGVLTLLTRAVQLQIIEGEDWAKLAESSRTERRVLPARRGALYDRNGVPLAVTQEFYHVGIAPNELDDPGAAFRLIVRSLGVSTPALDREFRARKRWIYLRGPFNATQVQPLRSLSGVHLEGSFQRFYPSRELARPVIGWNRTAPEAAPGWSWPWTRSSPDDPGRPCCSRTGRAAGTTRPRDRCATRCPGTMWCSPSTPSSRRSPSAAWPTRWKR
jgi:cell division protein FtsI (penicillin-binding protein 3)